MKKTDRIDENQAIEELCSSVKIYVENGEYQKCEEMICESMYHFPHAPEPHNLYGILLEKAGDHEKAMRHFRAAWALDPTYRPASQNLMTFGTFFSGSKCAYDESDCDTRY